MPVCSCPCVAHYQELSSDDGLDEKRAPAAPGPKPAPKKLPWFGAICSYNMVPASGAITGNSTHKC